MLCCWIQKHLTSMIPTDFDLFHTFEIRSFSYENGYFLMFCGSQSHVFSCLHETHDLGNLVSCYLSRSPNWSNKVIFMSYNLGDKST